jgi:hypothetical protein
LQNPQLSNKTTLHQNRNQFQFRHLIQHCNQQIEQHDEGQDDIQKQQEECCVSLVHSQKFEKRIRTPFVGECRSSFPIKITESYSKQIDAEWMSEIGDEYIQMR